MHRGIVQAGGNLGKVHSAAADELLGFLKLNATHIVRRGNLQMLLEQGGEVTGAHAGIFGNLRHRKLALHILGNVLLGCADNAVLVFGAVGGLQGSGGTVRAAQQLQ